MVRGRNVYKYTFIKEYAITPFNYHVRKYLNEDNPTLLHVTNIYLCIVKTA